MKRFVSFAAVVVFISWSCFAQTSADDTPATKADIERYLQLPGSHDMMKKMVAGMTQGMHQMMHEQYLKHQADLPADFESKMDMMMDGMLADMPFDEMIQSMAPVYQKYLTKGDVDNLIAFYSSPTGAKLLREMPAIMAEAMQNMMPVLTKYMDTVQQRLEKE